MFPATPNCLTILSKIPFVSIRKTKKFSLVKADEILLWLQTHDGISRWVVIDDLDLHNASIEKHPVKTDPAIGLTLEDITHFQVHKIILSVYMPCIIRTL